MNTDLHGPDADAALLAWWLDELPEAEANELEEHLFTCDACAARLESLLGLRQSVKQPQTGQ